MQNFWVDEWNCYVDVKSKYFYERCKFKFDAIKKTTDIKLKLLFKEDLINLGIVIK